MISYKLAFFMTLILPIYFNLRDLVFYIDIEILRLCSNVISHLLANMEVFNFDDLIHGSGKVTDRVSANKPYPRIVTSPIRDASRSTFSPVNSPLRVAKSVYEESTCQIKSPSKESFKSTNSPAQVYFMGIIQQVILAQHFN